MIAFLSASCFLLGMVNYGSLAGLAGLSLLLAANAVRQSKRIKRVTPPQPISIEAEAG